MRLSAVKRTRGRTRNSILTALCLSTLLVLIHVATTFFNSKDAPSLLAKLKPPKAASLPTPPVRHLHANLTIDYSHLIEPGLRFPTSGRSRRTNNTDVVSYVYSNSANWPERQAAALLFFIRQAIQSNVDYIFVINDKAPRAILNAIPRLPNTFIFHKDNQCFDLGSHPLGLDFAENVTGKRYQRLILLNSSVRGPFVAPFSKRCWTDLFFDLLDDRTKMVGTVHGCNPLHLQSMVLAYDRIGFDSVRKKTFKCWKTFADAWQIGEFGDLVAIESAGYSAKSLSSDAQALLYQLRSVECTHDTVYEYEKQNPFEILFTKVNRRFDQKQVNRRTEIQDVLPPTCLTHIPARQADYS